MSQSLPRHGAICFVEDVFARRAHVFLDDDDAFEPAVLVNAQHRLALLSRPPSQLIESWMGTNARALETRNHALDGGRETGLGRRG